MPGAMAKGLLARNAISSVPMPAEMTVARKMPFQRAPPTSAFAPKPTIRLGLSAMMYAMVMNVVRPATISVRAVVLFSFR